MKVLTTDFPPFTERQQELLEELKAAVDLKNRKKEIDDISVKVARFALKPLPKESRYNGLVLEVPTCGGRLVSGECKIKLGFADFHPDLPLWAKNHFIKWVLSHRTGFSKSYSRMVLRETGLVGIETGMPGEPEKLEDIERWELIKQKVLELRSVKENDIKRVDHQHYLQDRKRIKKPSATWTMVIDKLTDEKLLPRKITRQAFKKLLKIHFPYFHWDKV